MLICIAATGGMACETLQISAGRIDGVRLGIDAVTRAGAANCAPRELALAEAHYDFARMELAQGDLTRVSQHLDQAEENVGAAQVLTPSSSCVVGTVEGSSAASDAAPNAEALDSDRDGVSDERDACIGEVEDGRPPSEADGCKQADADGDGVADALDACPNQPHGRDETHADNGCPSERSPTAASGSVAARSGCSDGAVSGKSCPKRAYPHVTIADHELKLTTSIKFEDDSPQLLVSSLPVLDAVLQILRDHPSMTLDIAGHTDSRGDEARNQALSRERAERVRTYLVERGVEASRLTAQGYGETRPIETNSTSRGRAINRRIELIRTDATP